MNNDERVISLSDLFSVLLRNIVPIICVTLAFTLLGFAYSSRKSRSASITSAVPLQQEDLVRAEARRDLLADANKAANSEIELLEEGELSSLWKAVAATNQNLAQLADYCDNSPFMALDPFHCTIYDVSLLARSSGSGNNNSISSVGDQAAAAISAICTMDNSVLEKVRELLGAEQDLDFVRQLIYIYNDQDIVHIRLYCADTESAQSVIDYLCRTVTDRLRSDNLGFTVEEISRYNGTIVDSLVTKTINALKKTKMKTLVMGGGVSANAWLRTRLLDYCQRHGVRFCIPDRSLSTDNGAMIAAAAIRRQKQGMLKSIDVVKPWMPLAI